jgi:hypothetical protein
LKKTECYTLKEFEHQMGLPCRAFECTRTTGERAGEVYHLLVSPGGISCDCAGKSYESTARADWNAYLAGEPQFKTVGCIHGDAVALLLAAGLFDLPQPDVQFPAEDPKEISPARASQEPEYETCGYCCGTGQYPAPSHDRFGYEIEPHMIHCEYCGGTGCCEQGSKLLAHRAFA